MVLGGDSAVPPPAGLQGRAAASAAPPVQKLPIVDEGEAPAPGGAAACGPTRLRASAAPFRPLDSLLVQARPFCGGGLVDSPAQGAEGPPGGRRAPALGGVVASTRGRSAASTPLGSAAELSFLPLRTPSRTPSPRLAGYGRYSYCEQAQESLYLGEEPDEARLMAESRFQDFVYLRFEGAAPDARLASARTKCSSALSTTTCASGSCQPSPRSGSRAWSCAEAPNAASTCADAASGTAGASPRGAEAEASGSDADDDPGRLEGAPRAGSSAVRWPSAPAVVLSVPFRLKFPSMEEAHVKGECRPCAYFLSKVDGCRRGELCNYCHLCNENERKKRKKERIRQLAALKATARAQMSTAAFSLPR